MNVGDVLRILVRRRWIVVPALVLALVGGGVGYSRTAPQYKQAESYLLLYPVMTEGGPGNPFLQLGNGVSMAASVLATKVSAGSTAAALVAAHPGLTFTVALDVATGAPIVAVTAEGATPGAVGTALDVLGRDLGTQLADLQKASGAPEDSWVTISRLTRDAQAQPSHSAGMRNGAGVAVVVLLLALLLIAVLEGRSRLVRIRGKLGGTPPVPVAVRDDAGPAPRPGTQPKPPVPASVNSGNAAGNGAGSRAVVTAGEH